MECVFCKMRDGVLPATVHEDDRVLAVAQVVARAIREALKPGQADRIRTVDERIRAHLQSGEQ